MLRLRPVPAALTGTEPFYLIVTWFQSGRIRPASGTWGSLAALPFCWIIKAIGGLPLIVAFAVSMFFIGIWAVQHYTPHAKTPDPSEVVIDEVVGMAIVWAFTPANSVLLALAGFFLFRFFDAFKRGPVGWCDKNIKGALGVIVDDAVAGLIAGLGVMLLAHFLMPPL